MFAAQQLAPTVSTVEAPGGDQEVGRLGERLGP